MKKIILLVALVASSCIGSQERDDTILLAAQIAWELGVREDVHRGIERAIESGELEDSDALEALVDKLDEILLLGGSRVLLREIPWDLLRVYAAQGTDDPERLERFSRAFVLLLQARWYRPSRESSYPSLPGIGPTTDHAAIATLTTSN